VNLKFRVFVVMVGCIAPLGVGVAQARASVRLSSSATVSAQTLTVRGTVNESSGSRFASSVRVVLQERVTVGSREAWVDRARGRLGRGGRYAVRWRAPRKATAIVLRVVVTDGREVLARGRTTRIGLGSQTIIRATPRPTTVRPTPSAVVAVSGNPADHQTVVLAAGTPPPTVGAAIVVARSGAAPNGLLGLINSATTRPDGRVVVTTRPATLSQAYTSFYAHVDGTLGQLTDQTASDEVQSAATSKPVKIAKTPFKCKDRDFNNSITEDDIDLSSMRVKATVDASKTNPSLSFEISGQPTLNFGFDFSGSMTCTASAKLAPIPLGDTGLELQLGPEFTLSSSGKAGFDLTWRPSIDYGFVRSAHGGSSDTHTFVSHGVNVTVTGQASAKLSLALVATLSLGGRIGVTGTIGPEITGTATAKTNPASTCETISGDFAATLAVFWNFLGKWEYKLPTLQFGNTTLLQDPPKCSPGPVLPGPSITSPGDRVSNTALVTTLQISASAPRGQSLTYAAAGLPDGLTIDHATGLISGTPAKTGTYHVIVTVTDDAGQSASTSFTWLIVEGSSQPTVVVTNPGDQTSTVGSTVALKILASDSNDYPLVYSATNLPPGLKLASDTGQITGQPDTPGTYNVTITATDADDSNGPAGQTEFTWTIVPASAPSDGGMITAGAVHSCALRAGGGIDCWGADNEGQLGDGTANSTPTPVAVDGISKAIAVSAGNLHTCALLASGGVNCWGYNDFGQLGNGTAPDIHTDEGIDNHSATPVAVSGITDATAISAGGDGSSQTCALLMSHSIVCWGWNYYGQLGDGSTTDSSTPVTVSAITNAIAVSVGYVHACALLRGGGVDCWGYDEYGELGDGTTSDSSTPVAVKGITDATAIDAGEDGTCVVLASGGVDCWGLNDYGQLGDGTMNDSMTPVAVEGITNATAIDGGDGFMCALLATGAVECWGDNDEGELGDGSDTEVPAETPQPVSGITDATAIAAGGYHACVRLTGGAVECWGDNDAGQVGDGTAGGKVYAPVAVTGL